MLLSLLILTGIRARIQSYPSVDNMTETQNDDCEQICNTEPTKECNCNQGAGMIPYPQQSQEPCQQVCMPSMPSCVPCAMYMPMNIMMQNQMPMNYMMQNHMSMNSMMQNHGSVDEEVEDRTNSQLSSQPVESINIDKIIISTVTETRKEISTAAPITVTVQPQTVTMTRHAKPITSTLPPLVMQIPTTVYRTAKPETIVKILPPQVIYQPPKTKTITNKMIFAPSTITFTSTLPPIILPPQTSTVKGPTVVKHVKSPPQKITVVKSAVRYVTMPAETKTVEHYVTLAPVPAPTPAPAPVQTPASAPVSPQIPEVRPNMGDAAQQGNNNVGGSPSNFSNAQSSTDDRSAEMQCVCELPENSIQNPIVENSASCDCEEQMPEPSPCVEGEENPANECVENDNSNLGSMLESSYNQGGSECVEKNLNVCEENHSSSGGNVNGNGNKASKSNFHGPVKNFGGRANGSMKYSNSKSSGAFKSAGGYYRSGSMKSGSGSRSMNNF